MDLCYKCTLQAHFAQLQRIFFLYKHTLTQFIWVYHILFLQFLAHISRILKFLSIIPLAPCRSYEIMSISYTKCDYQPKKWADETDLNVEDPEMLENNGV